MLATGSLLSLVDHVALGCVAWAWMSAAVVLELWVVGPRPWLLRRGYRLVSWGKAPRRAEGMACTFRFDDEQFHSEQTGLSEGRVRWVALSDYAEDAHVAPLFLQPKRFFIEPCRALPGPPRAQVRRLALAGAASRPA